jgi:hypothetical protein
VADKHSLLAARFGRWRVLGETHPHPHMLRLGRRATTVRTTNSEPPQTLFPTEARVRRARTVGLADGASPAVGSDQFSYPGSPGIRRRIRSGCC